jgi:hypothetical protein
MYARAFISEVNWHEINGHLNEDMKATANHSKRTFTLRDKGNKYRTLQMSKIEFNEALYNTPGDWINYLKTNECLIIK